MYNVNCNVRFNPTLNMCSVQTVVFINVLIRSNDNNLCHGKKQRDDLNFYAHTTSVIGQKQSWENKRRCGRSLPKMKRNLNNYSIKVATTAESVGINIFPYIIGTLL